MKMNVGTLDRALRLIAGLALVTGSLAGWIGAWGWIGLILVATGVVGICPAYLPFGLSTCRSAK
jgi:hypothetical protein